VRVSSVILGIFVVWATARQGLTPMMLFARIKELDKQLKEIATSL